MIIETRYVIGEDYSGKIAVTAIEGRVSAKVVGVSRSTRELQYRSRVPIASWNQLATTPKGAAEKWLERQKEALASAERRVQQSQEDIAKAEAFLNTIK